MLGRLNCSNIIIIGDSLNIINMVQGLTPPGWDIKSMIIEARRLLYGIENVIIQHNFLEAKFLSDKIADEAMGLTNLMV